MKAIEEWNPIKGYNSVINYFRSKDETPEDLKADIKWCNSRFLAFSEYTTAVMSTALESIYDSSTDRENYISDVEERDRSRKLIHDNVISACAFFNRTCDQAGLPRFCPDIPEDKASVNRELIGEFASYVAMYVFNKNAGISDEKKIKVMKDHIIDIMNRSF